MAVQLETIWHALMSRTGPGATIVRDIGTRRAYQG